MNTLITRPEFRLALSITGTVLAVLVGVVIIASSFAFITDMNRQQELFRVRQEMIQNRPGFLENFKKSSVPAPERRGMSRRFAASALRNIIVLSKDGHAETLGPLENVSFSNDVLGDLPVNTIKERLIDGEVYTLYAFPLADKMIVLYEPSELLKGPRTIAFFSTFWAIVLFSILLFFLSLRIARKVIEPIQDLAEKERAYARHIAHELKTPLSVIKSDLELALALPDETNDRIGSVMGEVSAMGSVIDDLLLLSAGITGLVKKPVDLRWVILEIIGKWEDIIRWEIPKWPENTTIEWEERLLRTLVKNLVANVRSHAVSGTTATVRFEPHGFVFENEAENISDDIKKRAFDPFVGTPGKWSGIGLSLVKRIAELHGWTVSFEVKEGKVWIGVWY